MESLYFLRGMPQPLKVQGAAMRLEAQSSTVGYLTSSLSQTRRSNEKSPSPTPLTRKSARDNPNPTMAYSALESQHIRTLKLEQSAQHESLITCSLVPLLLSESASPQYEALSYVWGDAAERNEILLDGLKTSITRNLWTALKHVRKPDSPRTLWVDAVCINQDDVQERNEQVRQMGRIYSQAERVLIWLGPPDAEIEKTMLAFATPGALNESGFEQFPKDVVLGIRKILSQPWWHRMWVLQEHILATADPVVGCGNTWIEWAQLSKSVLHYSRCMIDESGSTIMDESSTWVKDPFAILRHILLRKQLNDPSYLLEERGTIAEIVERTRGYQATDKRDQVFAIRDLLRKDDKDLFPEPDYTRTTSEVYQEAVMAFLRSKKSLAFLIHAFGRKDNTLGLPSWCVDFSKKLWDWGTYGNHAGGSYLPKGEDSEEIQEYMSILAHDPSLGTLKVLGGVLGQVLVSRPLIPALSSDQRQITAVVDGREELLTGSGAEKLLIFSQFVKEVLRMSSIYCKIWEDRQDLQTAKEKLAAGEVWETIFGGILFNMVDAACIHAGIPTIDGGDRPREFWVVEAFVRLSCPWYADALRRAGIFHPTPELADSDELRRALWETVVLVTQVNAGKWWFATDSGYVGRVEREVEASDRLCMILGCRVPLVLRPCEEGYRMIALPQSHDFIGDHHREQEKEVKREIFTLR